MRKYVSISFLMLVFMSQVGYYFFYTLKRSDVQAEMQQQLSESTPQRSLQVFVLEENARAIHWEEVGKEFYLNGNLYDVAFVKKVNGKTFLYCISDDKEEQVAKDMAKAASSGNDNASNGKDNKHSIKFQLNDYIIISNNQSTYSAVFLHQEYFDHKAAICSNPQPVNIHPPRA